MSKGNKRELLVDDPLPSPPSPSPPRIIAFAVADRNNHRIHSEESQFVTFRLLITMFYNTRTIEMWKLPILFPTPSPRGAYVPLPGDTAAQACLRRQLQRPAPEHGLRTRTLFVHNALRFPAVSCQICLSYVVINVS